MQKIESMMVYHVICGNISIVACPNSAPISWIDNAQILPPDKSVKLKICVKIDGVVLFSWTTTMLAYKNVGSSLEKKDLLMYLLEEQSREFGGSEY